GRRVALRGRLRALAVHPHEDGGEGPGLAGGHPRGPPAREAPTLDAAHGPGRGGRPRGDRARRKGPVAMALLTMREALNQALKEEMSRDPSVFILGEEVGAYQGAYKVTQGLVAQFGEWRVRDTPIAEEAIAGIAVGAAFIGLRP